MKNLRVLQCLLLAFTFVLSGCFQLQVKGPVGGGTVMVTKLGEEEPIAQLESWDVPFLVNLYGADKWSSFTEIVRVMLTGVVPVDRTLYESDGYYMLIASGGRDWDVNQDLLLDTVGSEVNSKWHAIVAGAEMKVTGVQISVLSEIVYQYLSLELGNLSEIDLRIRLDLLAQRMVGDIEADGDVDYVDLLRFSQVLHRESLQVNEILLAEFEDQLLAGASASSLRQLAAEVVESGTARSGEMVYRFTQPTGNSFTCDTCHALTEPSANGLRRPGHPLGDATRRPSYKNGQLGSMLDAVNTCLDEWMNADLWTESSHEWLVLSPWLDSMAPPVLAEPVVVEVVDPPVNLDGGDAESGRETFNESCAVCHNIDGAGSFKAPPVVGFGLEPELVANRVRRSGRADSAVYPNLSGGIMPFWGNNRLGDDELLDIVAYLGMGEDANNGSGGGGGSGNSCGDDHPKVGQSATLTTRAHGVSGVVTMIDNCTLELTGFIFDGRGIVVQAYTGVDGNFFGNGVHAISANLVGPAFNNATLQFSLPDGVTLDDFNSFSIWCVAVGVSFGDGIFR